MPNLSCFVWFQPHGERCETRNVSYEYIVKKGMRLHQALGITTVFDQKPIIVPVIVLYEICWRTWFDNYVTYAIKKLNKL